MSSANGSRNDWVYWRLEGFQAATVGSAMDHALLHFVAPTVKIVISRKLVCRFFFLRYHEGGPHLRLRFKLGREANRDDLEAVVHKMLGATEPELQLVEALYEPEVEKYGGSEALEIAERHFSASSSFALHCIQRTTDQMALRWITAVSCFCATLAAAGYDAEKRLHLLKTYSTYWRSMYWHLTGLTVARYIPEANVADLLNRIVAADGGLRVPFVAVTHWTKWVEAMGHDMWPLRRLSEEGRLAAPLDRVVSSLVHTFHNRLGLGVVDEVLIADSIAARYAPQSSFGDN